MTTISDKFEYVSIVMDNEDLSEEMLDKLLADDAAVQKWYEYHLISDCMKEQAVGCDADFMQNPQFTAALAEISREHQVASAAKTAQTLSEQKAANSAFKGFAVAASLAAVAVSVWQFWPQAGDTHMPVATEKVQSAPADQNVVPVKAAEPEKKSASDTVVPNAAKQLPPPRRTTTVRTENQVNSVTAQQDIVQ